MMQKQKTSVWLTKASEYDDSGVTHCFKTNPSKFLSYRLIYSALNKLAKISTSYGGDNIAGNMFFLFLFFIVSHPSRSGGI